MAPILTAVSDSTYNQYLCEKIQDIANKAIETKGSFFLGVSGGSAINFLSEGLPMIKTDWKLWKIFLCDERLVDESDPESTYGLYKKKLFPVLPDFPYQDNFLKANTEISSEESAREYQDKLKNLFKSDEDIGADCLILGVGPDGHTCSLFPNHSLLELKDESTWVTWIEDSPKPPPKRITLTYPFINKSKNILVSGKGKEKWEIWQKIQNGEDFPIGRINNSGGHLEWILNEC